MRTRPRKLVEFPLYALPTIRGRVSVAGNRSSHENLPTQVARFRASAFVLTLGALGLLAAVAATAQADPKVLAKIDGVPITEDDFNDALADIGPGLPEKMEGAERQKYVLDYLIDLKLVAKQALADKLDGGADFARRLAYYHDKLAMEALLTGTAKSATTEEAERKAYDEAAKAQPPEPEVHARHILLLRRKRPRRPSRASRPARISPKSRPHSRRTRPATAEISAGSPRTGWCPNSPTRRSSSSRARSPIP